MKKALSLLLFVLIAVGMSLPAFAGELTMRNQFNVTGSSVDRGDITDYGTQTAFTSIIGSLGSYSAEPGFSINWKVEAMDYTWGVTEDNDYDGDAGELTWKMLYSSSINRTLDVIFVGSS